MLKAVIFDLGWTLVDLFGVHEFNEALKAEIGEKRYEVVKDYFIQAHRESMDEEQWVRDVAYQIDANASQIEKLKAKIHWTDYALYPDALSTLAALKQRGLKIGLISNATIWARPALEELGIAPYLDSTVISCEIGVMKPEKEIFKRALRDLGCQAAEAIMVGDSLKADVLGAETAGMTGILLDRKNEIEYPQKIQTLSELL